VEAAAFTPPLSAALGLSCRRLATAGNEALGRCRLPFSHPSFPLRSDCLAGGSLPRATRQMVDGGCRPHTHAFRCARLVLQTIRYRGQRSAWQVGATAPTPPLSAVLGLSRRRLATAGNDALGRCGLPLTHPRFPLRSAFLAGGSLPQATKHMVDGGCHPPTPVFRCARLDLPTARYRGQRGASQVGAAAPTPRFPLRSAFLAKSSLLRVT